MPESYFLAIYRSALGEWMRTEVWRVPAVEFVHLIGIVLLMGSVLIVNLRLFGVMLRAQPVSGVAAGVGGFQKLGLLFIALSGPVLFTTSATKFYMTPPFWWKMGFLALAILFQFTLHARAVHRGDAQITKAAAWGAAALSLFLWFGVLLNGMWTLLT